MRLHPLAGAVALLAATVTVSSQATNVLLLGDGDAETQVQLAFESAGLEVVYGGLYNEWDGITPDVNDFDVVVYLDGYYYGNLMTEQGEIALAEFVAGGGALVITEWATYDANYGNLSPAIAAMLPVVYDGDYEYGATWHVIDDGHPITAGLPPTWTDGAEYSFVNALPGSTVLIENESGRPMLTYWTAPGGLVVHLNHDMTYTTSTIRPLSLATLTNATYYAGGGTPPDCDGNGTADYIDLLTDATLDLNSDGVLDACQPDCNENGLPDDLDITGRNVAPTDFEMIEFAPDLDWTDSDDDNESDLIELPWPVTLGNETYVAFVLSSNGYVELLREGEDGYGVSYGPVDALVTFGDPTHTYLLAAYDDLDSYSFGLYGYKLADDRVIFYWNTETNCDEGDGLLSTFEVVLYPDGTVQWDFLEGDFVCHGYDLFTGLYLGHEEQLLLEVISGDIPTEQCWRYTATGGVEEIPFEFLSTTIPLDWQYSGDDEYSEVTALPWPLVLGGETYVAFVQDSNGYVELLREGELPYYYGYGSVEELTTWVPVEGDPTHTYLMAAYDDLDSDYGGFFGYRIEPDRVIFHWYTETYDDDDDGLHNDFQIILAPDGTVRWNFDEALYASYGYDLFTGVYLGHGLETLHEVASGVIPQHQSWLFSEEVILGGGSLDDDGDGIPDECDGVFGDLNGDGIVNGADLGMLLGSWGPCIGCPADLSADGGVDGADLGLLLGAWTI